MKSVSVKESGFILVVSMCALQAFGQSNATASRSNVSGLTPPVAQMAFHLTSNGATNKSYLLNVPADSARSVQKKDQTQTGTSAFANTGENTSKPKKSRKSKWFGDYLLTKLASKFNE